MILQDNPYDFINVADLLSPLISIVILIVLMLLMVLVYMKLRVFLLILTIFLFSLFLGYNAIENSNGIPFSPYIQIFFMAFQSVIFILTTIKVFTIKEK